MGAWYMTLISYTNNTNISFNTNIKLITFNLSRIAYHVYKRFNNEELS